MLLEDRIAIKEFFVEDLCCRDSSFGVAVANEKKTGLVRKLKQRFIDEARALRRLSPHSGIVGVSDVFEENGTAYFVMDYVDGQSLSEIIKAQGPLTEERALRYVTQVASALSYVHDNNRLHLDIKPGNIMIDREDKPVLIDFGASKQYAEDEGENTSALTGKTAGYAPPEQMSNSVVSFLPATDIYALGATLYKLLSGITPVDSLLRISGESVAPLPENISLATRHAINAAMSIRRSERPQSVDAFLRMLSSSDGEEDTVFDDESRPQNKKQHSDSVGNSGRRSYKGIVIMVCCAVLGLSAGYFVIEKVRTVPPKHEKSDMENVLEEPSGQGQAEAPSGSVTPPAARPSPSKVVSNGTLNLGYGTWKGGIKNGRPHGRGRLTFSESHTVDRNTSYKAAAGDYFVANYDNGSLVSGKLYDADGNLLKTIIP